MSIEPTTDPAGQRRDEVEALRQRVASLESELADRAARTNDALAAAQERTYWLDRWHLDLNALMARPLPARLWRLMPPVRAAYRGVRNAREALAKARFERSLSSGDEDAAPAATGAGSEGPVDVDEALRSTGVRVEGGQRVLHLGGPSATPAAHQPDVDWQESSAGTPPLPYAAGAFDVAGALTTWSEGGDDLAVDWLRELHRVVRPGGHLVLGLGTHAPLSPRWLLAHATPDWEVAEFLPGGAGRQDLYALRRR